MSKHYSLAELYGHREDVVRELDREDDVDTRNRLRAELRETDRALLLARYERGELHAESGDGGADGVYRREGTSLRGQALTANERAELLPDAAREHMARTIESDDDPQERLARAVIELSQRPYLRAIQKWMRDPVSGGHEWTPEERGAVRRVRVLERAMSLTGANGGYLLPYELDPAVLLTNASSVNPLRQIARVDTTALNTKKYVTSAGVSAHFYDEAAEVSDDAPSDLAQPSITCRKAMAWVPVSFELFEDSDIAREVGVLFADAKAQLEATALTTGDGVAPNPKGIITALVAAGGSTVIATGTNVLAQGDLYANQAALPARWRPNAHWMMNLSVLNGYRQLPLATGLNYSIVDDSGPRPRALGWEIHENSAMDGTLGAGADYLVLSGDFKQFAILDRLGATIETVPVVFGANGRPSGERGFLLHWRIGSDVLIADAFRLSNFST